MEFSKTTVLATTAVVAWALACGASEDERDVSAADVQEEAAEALDAAVDYAAKQREELATRAQEAVDDVDREIEEARRGLAEIPAEAREQLHAAITRAERARDALGREFGELRNASADRWEAAQERLSNAMDEIEEARREVTAALAGDGPKPSKSSS